MLPETLYEIAESETEAVLRRLPEDLTVAARECAVFFEETPAAVEAGEDPDLLGLFEGQDRFGPPSSDPGDFPRIWLFLANIWEESGEDESIYRKEVRTTFLHELGHYLGLDEDAVEALGLG